MLERARLRGRDPAVSQPPQAERAHAQRVAHGEQRVRRHDRERVRPAHPPHHVVEALLPRPRRRQRQQVRDQLRVGRAVQLDPHRRHVVPQHVRVDQVPVVRDRDLRAALAVPNDDRLRVPRQRPARRAVARVPDGDVPLQARQVRLVEHVRHEPHARAQSHRAAVARGDPGALLAAVLERVEAVEGKPSDILSRPVDAENATGLARMVAAVAQRLVRPSRVASSPRPTSIATMPSGATRIRLPPGGPSRPRRPIPCLASRRLRNTREPAPEASRAA